MLFVYDLFVDINIIVPESKQSTNCVLLCKKLFMLEAVIKHKNGSLPVV